MTKSKVKKRPKPKKKKSNSKGTKKDVRNPTGKTDNDFPYSQKLTLEKLDTESWFDHENHWSDCHLYEETLWQYRYKTVMRSRPIKIYPNQEQKERLLKWIDLLRHLYNHAVRHSRKYGPDTNKTRFRNDVYKKLDKKLQVKLTEAKVLKHIQSEVIMDVSKAYKTCFALKAANHIKKFRIRNKKASKPKQSLPIPHDAFSLENGFCITALGKMKTSEPVNKNTIHHQCRLVYQDGEFTLWVPTQQPKYLVENRQPMVALDPGMRTFQTLYDGKNCMKIGNNCYKKVKRYILKLYNTKAISNQKKIQRMLKKYHRKGANAVDDMHWKTAKFLVINYDTIYIGKLSTKGVVSKKGNLNKVCKQSIILLKHFQFRTRLQEKAEQYGAKVICVNEAYTSQTCGKCGTRNKKLKGAKVFTCADAECDFTYDRDFNGARNIMRKGNGIDIGIGKY